MKKPGQIDLFTKRVRKLPPVKEFVTQVMIADDLKRWCRPEWRYTHIASGELRDKAVAAKLTRMGLVAGWPDFALLGPPGLHCLELKREGEKQTLAQEEFEAFCLSNGTPYDVAYNYKDAIAILTRWDVLRVKITP